MTIAAFDGIRKMLSHFNVIVKHKAIVLKECSACGILIQGILHDMSKFHPVEFIPSAKYFQGNTSPILAEIQDKGYSEAWLHHKAHNKHHWQYWIDFNDDGFVVVFDMPTKYAIEMVCDWIGAGKVYSGENWTQASPLEYYLTVKDGMLLSNKTEKLVSSMLEIINDYGLEEFHKYCKGMIR